MAAANFVQILENINKNLPALWKLVTGGTYLAGIWFAFRAIYHFKEYGELRMMMAVNTDLRKPLISLFIAVILLYWPTLVQVMLQSSFGADSLAPAPYIGSGTTPLRQTVLSLGGRIIQLIGFIAFVRGWVLMSYIGRQGAQPGMFAKAMTHILGGLLAVNIFGTWRILESIIQV